MKIRLISYNIDGLPDKVDLNNLPWPMRPIAWLYRIFKGTTVVDVNDNGGREEATKCIGKYLRETNADMIALQEDFNYHDTLVSMLSGYCSHTHTGGFFLNHLFRDVKWWPLPRFKADGLSLFTRTGRIEVMEEEVVRWRKSCGYFGHGSDKLTMKGFRYYRLVIDASVEVEMYVVHMDADFYNSERRPDIRGDIDARTSQMEQLSDYIFERDSSLPMIIIGDTNCSHYYEWDAQIVGDFLDRLNSMKHLTAYEQKADNLHDVDRMFFVNNSRSRRTVSVSACRFEDNWLTAGRHASDHSPLVVDVEVK